MISQLWRERVIYTAMSLFLAWHTLAIAIAPAPESSEAVQSLRALLQPYLTLFRLDNKWDFYAPAIDRGRQFRYVIEDAAGVRHQFVPSDELNWFHPAYWWFRQWYDVILDYTDDWGDAAAALLCRKHAALRPVAVTLLKLQERNFSPRDHLSGKNPLDPEFITVRTLKRVPCREK